MGDKYEELKSLGAPALVDVVRDPFLEGTVYAFCEGGVLFRTKNFGEDHPIWERYIVADASLPVVVPPPYIPS